MQGIADCLCNMHPFWLEQAAAEYRGWLLLSGTKDGLPVEGMSPDVVSWSTHHAWGRHSLAIASYSWEG